MTMPAATEREPSRLPADQPRRAPRRPLSALVAYDGSEDSQTALDLAASLDWPMGSQIQVMSVVDSMPYYALHGLPTEVRQRVAVEASDHDEIAARFHDALQLERELRVGRPASVIVQEAEAMDADIVILGSRGHGLLDGARLGSVSAEVVDHAPCPVLVGRTSGVRQIVVADDGSETARVGLDFLADTALFLDAEVKVLSIAAPPPLLHVGIAPTMYREALDAQAELLGLLEEEHRAIASRAADRLRGAGYTVSSEVRRGFPASEIVEASRAADLVVVGTHGRTGISRLVMGSVARNVLHHAFASVLIARARLGGRRPQEQPPRDPA